MNLEKCENLFHLKTVLRSMEQDMGLGELPDTEVDVLLVAQSLTKKIGDVVTSQNIRTHDLVHSLAPATFHRALRALVDRGLLFRADGAKTKSYVVNAG